MWGISQNDNNTQINAYKTQYGITNPCAGIEGGGINAFNVITEDQSFFGYPTYCIVCPDKKINFNICFPPDTTCFAPYFESCYPPPSANFSADITSPVLGEIVSFTDLSTENPTSWSWTFIPSTITYVGGTSSLSQNPQVQFLSTESYTVELTVVNSEGSDTEIKTDYINVSNYCYAAGSANLLHISNVAIGDINNSSEQDYYTDFTNLSTDLLQGQQDVEITIENGHPYGNDDLGIWIDWDQNGDFYGSGENVVCEVDNLGQGTFLFNVPENAVLATTTMRVRIKYNGSNCGDPCGTSIYGEVEDYSLNILHPEININITVFLEGPFNGTDMNPSTSAGMPLSQPYNIPPWNYNGTESVLSMPDADIVDWVLIELRDTPSVDLATSETRIGQQAAFIKNNGQLIDTSGNPILTFPGLSVSNNLFVVIFQRNHIAVISDGAITALNGIYSYDFSTGENQAHGGTDGHKQLTSGLWGMFSGDGNADGSVNSTDKSPLWDNQSGNEGYLESDFSLDGQSNNIDKDDYWEPNEGKNSQVPN